VHPVRPTEPQVTSYSMPRDISLAAGHASQHPRQRPPRVVPHPSKNGAKARPMASRGWRQRVRCSNPSHQYWLIRSDVDYLPKVRLCTGLNPRLHLIPHLTCRRLYAQRRRFATRSSTSTSSSIYLASLTTERSSVAQWQISKQHSQYSQHTVHCPPRS
jgi:hypothetical protein